MQAIIIGAGPAGLSTALRLQQTTDIRCTIYELRPEPTTMGGAIAIFSNGLRLLDQMGLFQPLKTRGNSRSTFVIRSIQGDIIGEQEDAVSYARARTGFGHMRVKRTDIIDVMLQAVSEAKIPVHYNKKLTTINEDEKGVTVTFADGTSDTADLLIGCDGIHSYVRKLYVDPDQAPEYSGFSSLGSIVPVSSLPPDTAAAASKQLSGLSATFTEEGMFMATVCTAAGDEISWGFSEQVSLPNSGDSRDGWEVRRKEEVDMFKANMHKILANANGEWSTTLRQLVDKSEVIKFYPIYRLPLGGTWSKGRCILLGDAAHAMQPHAGQGVSMALEDAFLLSRLLCDSSKPLTEVFETFDQIRRPRVEEIHKLSAHNANIRKKSGPWGLMIKETILKLAFLVSGFLKLDMWGFGQKHLIYDIAEVKV